jgi:hypothetical protein
MRSASSNYHAFDVLAPFDPIRFGYRMIVRRRDCIDFCAAVINKCGGHHRVWKLGSTPQEIALLSVAD